MERAGLRGIDTGRGTLGDLIVSANGKTVELSVKRGSGTVTVPVEVTDVGRSP